MRACTMCQSRFFVPQFLPMTGERSGNERQKKKNGNENEQKTCATAPRVHLSVFIMYIEHLGACFLFFFCLFVCCVCACTCKYYVTTAGKKKNVVRELSIFSLPQQEACCIRTTRLYSIPSSASSKWFCLFVKFVICARIINAQRQFFSPLSSFSGLASKQCTEHTPLRVFCCAFFFCQFLL